MRTKAELDNRMFLFFQLRNRLQTCLKSIELDYDNTTSKGISYYKEKSDGTKERRTFVYESAIAMITAMQKLGDFQERLSLEDLTRAERYQILKSLMMHNDELFNTKLISSLIDKES